MQAAYRWPPDKDPAETNNVTRENRINMQIMDARHILIQMQI